MLTRIRNWDWSFIPYIVCLPLGIILVAGIVSGLIGLTSDGSDDSNTEQILDRMMEFCDTLETDEFKVLCVQRIAGEVFSTNQEG